MILLVGLGNPGEKYTRNRHNIGFMAADAIVRRHSFSPLRSRFQGLVSEGSFGGEKAIVLMPMTYMNESGRSVGEAMRFYKLTPDQVLVIHDELDLPPGQAKLKRGDGHAGHNGLRDIQSAFSSPDFWRLRIGIGHPRDFGLAQQVAAFVLNQPRPDELTQIEGVIDRCRSMLPVLLQGDFERATSELHTGNR